MCASACVGQSGALTASPTIKPPATPGALLTPPAPARLPELPGENDIRGYGDAEKSMLAAGDYIYTLEYEGAIEQPLYRTSIATGEKKLLLEAVVNDFELVTQDAIYVNALESTEVVEDERGVLKYADEAVFFRVDIKSGEAEKISEGLFSCQLIDGDIIGMRTELDTGHAECALYRIGPDGKEKGLIGRYDVGYAVACARDGYAYLYDGYGGGSGEMLRVALDTGESVAIAEHGIPYVAAGERLYYVQKDDYEDKFIGPSALYWRDLANGEEHELIDGDAGIKIVDLLDGELLLCAYKDSGTWYFAYSPADGACAPLFRYDAHLLCVHQGFVYYTTPSQLPESSPFYNGLGSSCYTDICRVRADGSGNEQVFTGAFTDACAYGGTLCIAAIDPEGGERWFELLDIDTLALTRVK